MINGMLPRPNRGWAQSRPPVGAGRARPGLTTGRYTQPWFSAQSRCQEVPRSGKAPNRMRSAKVGMCSWIASFRFDLNRNSEHHHSTFNQLFLTGVPRKKVPNAAESDVFQFLWDTCLLNTNQKIEVLDLSSGFVRSPKKKLDFARKTLLTPATRHPVVFDHVRVGHR